jgi:succinoglycan biosynthesis transport protein ExoP
LISDIDLSDTSVDPRWCQPEPSPPSLLATSTQAAAIRPSEIDLFVYWLMFRKRMLSVVSVLAIVLAATIIWTLRQPRIYEGAATLDIEQSAPQVLGSKVEDVVDQGGGNFWYSREFYETQYKIIVSRAVGQRVVDKLALAEDPGFLGLDSIKDPALRRQAAAGIDAIAELQSRTRIEPVKDSHLAIVHVEDTEPKRAALLTNALAQAYIDENADRRLEATKNAADWLESQASGLKTSLENSELALYNYKRDNDILSMSLEDQQNTVSQKLRTLSDEITKAQTRKIELAAEIEQLHVIQAESKVAGEFQDEGFGAVVQSSMIQTLKGNYFKQKETVAQLSQRYEPKHPTLLQAEAELEVARKDLQREIEHIVGASEGAYRAASASEVELQRLFEEVRSEAFNVNKREIDYKKLDREAKNNSELYDLVLKRLKETDLTSLLKTNNIHLLDASIIPAVPIRPNRTRNAILAAVVGLLGGLALAFVQEKLDNTFKGQDDVESILGVSFLGIVPSITEEGLPSTGNPRDLYVHTHPKSSVAECCRSVRTNLLFMSPDRPLRRLLITSSGPQEGKTTVVVSLGIVMAQSGNRVLLVDTDMRRPRLHRALGVSNDIGLSTAVVGETQIEDCIQPTAVPNLWVLPCGPIPPNPAELLHAERFRKLIASLSDRYDRVIFDSPPLGAVADAAVLATQTDGTLVVLKGGKTTYEMARRAIDSLSGINAFIAGALLNDLDLENQEYGYYYYYYRRGYYDESLGKRPT